MKAGFEIFLTSERNSVPTQIYLFEQLKCTTIITPDPTFAPVKAILEAAPDLTLIVLPAWTTLVSAQHEPYPFDKSSSANARDTCFVVHSSGTTGFPKPIKIPFEAVSRMVNCLTLPDVEQHQTIWSILRNKRCIDLLPLNHPAGVNIGILNALYNQYTIILPPHGIPPTAQTLSDMLDCVTADWSATAPLTLETLSKDSNLTQNVVSKGSMLLYSGGSLPKVFGDVLSRNVKLLSGLGSSETGPITTLYHRDFDWISDWNYLKFHPQMNIRLDTQPGGVVELVFDKTKESEPYQAVFVANKDLSEYRSKDLFVRHAVIPDLWTHVSRSDDIIVFLNGEKVNPVVFESLVAKHPRVSSVIMFGNQRFEPGLLIETAGSTLDTLAEKAGFLDEIWPTISEASLQLPGYAKVSRSHVLFTRAGNPFLRTLKNSVRKQPTLSLYKADIDKLYHDSELMSLPEVGVFMVQASEVGFEIGQMLRKESRFKDLGPEDDFFDLGMDSLQVLRLVRYLRQITGIPDLDPSLVYSTATINSLSRKLETLSAQHKKNYHEERDKRNGSLNNLVDELWADLSRGLNHVSREKAVNSAASGSQEIVKDHTVLLTGSTGSIGRYILQELMKDASVSRIYCLSRSDYALELQRTRNLAADSSLSTDFDRSRVIFCTADYSQAETLGLPEEQYQDICAQVTHIIHAAWPVDFNRSLKYFRPALHGLASLLALRSGSKHNADFMFISSISSAMASQTVVSEELANSPDLCPLSGYAESKWAAEALVGRAASLQNASRFTIVRLGQIAGSLKTGGGWNMADWVPALIISSAHLGFIPDILDAGNGTDLGNNCQWMPIDVIAEVIIELLFSSAWYRSHDRDLLNVFQPLNPHATTWQELLHSVVDAIATEGAGLAPGERRQPRPQIVSPAAWLKALRSSAHAGDGSDAAFERLVKQNPALKLRSHFEARYGVTEPTKPTGSTFGFASWGSQRAMTVSEALKKAGPITGEDMRRWIGQWFAQVRADA